MVHSRDLATITKGRFLNFVQDWPIEYLITDSRHPVPSVKAVFFAIKGKNHDGHAFLEDLYRKGVRQFVIEEEGLDVFSSMPEANIVSVANSVIALQKMAEWHRNQFHLNVIGITGSNGKTIVKEWLYQLLSPSWSVVKSPKSYNSQIGVPLSVWQIKEEHEVGIFEAGISHTEEMRQLADIIQPNLGVLTNIGPAHSEGFSSLEEKIKEKALLFKDSETIVYNKSYLEVDKVLSETFPSEKLLNWSYDKGAKIQARILGKKQGKTEIQLGTHHTPLITHYTLPFVDDASLENILHCIVVAEHLKVAQEDIQERISHLSNVHMRLELKAGKHDSYVIDDTYNNDPEGLKIALNFMQQQAVKANKVVILSDMLETGILPSTLYKVLADLLKEKQIDLLLAVGPEISLHKAYFPDNTLFFSDTESLLGQLSKLRLEDSLILVKGARTFRFERVVQVLAQKIHRTVLEINLNALAHNLNVFRQLVKPETKMMVMVKAFAYGAGSDEVAHLLQYNKVDYLAVAYTDEGIELRENNVSLPVMVMNPAPDEFDKLAKNQLEPEIYSFKLLEALIEFLESNPQIEVIQPIHLAIDTGMHRLGFEKHEIPTLCAVLKQQPRLKVASVFSHLVGADEPEHDLFSETQAELFMWVAEKIETELGYKVIKHLLNSAGITRLPQYQFDMVRLGIGLYGMEAEGHPKKQALQTVGTLKTMVSQVHQVKEGESVGYSRKGRALRDSKIATIAIGYADGFSRRFSNGAGKAWVKGRLVPVIGNVCMDMTMLDVTDVEVMEGDEVILFGKELPVQDVAKAIGTIPYEILTNVSERVKRVFYVD